MLDLGLVGDAQFFQGAGPKPTILTDTSTSQVGYVANNIAAVSGQSGYVWLNDAKTRKAKGWELYINDEPTSFKTGSIVEFAGTTYTVGPIVTPQLNVKTAKFFNTVDISGDPMGGATMANTRKARVFDISINLT